MTFYLISNIFTPQGGGTAPTAITTQLCGIKVNGFYLVGVKPIFRESKDGNALRSEFRSPNFSQTNLAKPGMLNV